MNQNSKYVVNGCLTSSQSFYNLCLQGKLEEVKNIVNNLSFEGLSLYKNKYVMNQIVDKSKGTTGFLAFCELINDKILTVLEYLITHDKLKSIIDFNKTDSKGNTILHYVNRYSAKLLSEHFGQYVNVKNNEGFTPLHYAAWRNEKEVVIEFLKIKEVNVNIQIGTSTFGSIKKPKFLYHYHEGRTALIMAIYSVNLEVAKLFLERSDVDVNLPDAYGNGPLYYATIKYPSDICEELLKRPDIDVNRCYKGKNLFVGFSGDCISGGYEIMCPKVMNHESFDFNFTDEEGDHALFYLLGVNKTRITPTEKFLLEFIKNPKTNINAVNKHGVSFFQLLCYLNSEHIPIVMERTDLNINCRNKAGATPLYFVITNKNFDLAKKLLENDKLDVNYEFKFLMEQYEAPTGKEFVRKLIDENSNIVEMFLGRADLNIDRSIRYPRTLTITHSEKASGVYWKFESTNGHKVYDYGFKYDEIENWS